MEKVIRVALAISLSVLMLPAGVFLCEKGANALDQSSTAPETVSVTNGKITSLKFDEHPAVNKEFTNKFKVEDSNFVAGALMPDVSKDDINTQSESYKVIVSEAEKAVAKTQGNGADAPLDVQLDFSGIEKVGFRNASIDTVSISEGAPFSVKHSDESIEITTNKVGTGTIFASLDRKTTELQGTFKFAYENAGKLESVSVAIGSEENIKPIALCDIVNDTFTAVASADGDVTDYYENIDNIFTKELSNGDGTSRSFSEESVSLLEDSNKWGIEATASLADDSSSVFGGNGKDIIKFSIENDKLKFIPCKTGTFKVNIQWRYADGSIVDGSDQVVSIKVNKDKIKFKGIESQNLRSSADQQTAVNNYCKLESSQYKTIGPDETSFNLVVAKEKLWQEDEYSLNDSGGSVKMAKDAFSLPETLDAYTGMLISDESVLDFEDESKLNLQIKSAGEVQVELFDGDADPNASDDNARHGVTSDDAGKIWYNGGKDGLVSVKADGYALKLADKTAGSAAEWADEEYADTIVLSEANGELVQVTPNDSNPDNEKPNLHKYYVKATDGSVFMAESSCYYDSAAPQYESFIISPSESKGDDGVFAKILDAVKGIFYSSQAAKVTMNVSDGDGSGIKSLDVDDVGADGHASPESNEQKTEWSIDLNDHTDINIKNWKVNVVDYAGNNIVKSLYDAKEVPQEIRRVISDSTAPEITLDFTGSSAVNGKYFKRDKGATRTAVLTVTVASVAEKYLSEYCGNNPVFTYSYKYPDGKSGKESVLLKSILNGSKIESGDENLVKYQYLVSFDKDGVYKISKCSFTDVIGRVAKADCPGEFVIDNTAPKTSVEFDNDDVSNGKYYNAARTATVTVTEHNFSKHDFVIDMKASGGNGKEYTPPSIGTWVSKGDTHTIKVSFPGQGTYSLNVSGQDLASNSSNEVTVDEFVIDTVKPEISIKVGGISNPKNRAFSKDAPLSVDVKDTNADGSTKTSCDIKAISWNNEGSPYKEKRSTSATVVSIKCADPAYKASSDGVYRVTVKAVDMAGNTNSKTADWSVNRFGSTYILSSATSELLETKYLRKQTIHDINVTEINPSGLQEDKTQVTMTLGNQNSQLEKNVDYSFTKSSGNSWPAYEYKIKSSNFVDNGTYQITLHSVDNAGHESENTMAKKNEQRTNSADIMLVYDNVSPVCTSSGFEESTVAASQHEVKLNLEDNIAIRSAKIKVNDQVVGEFGDGDANGEVSMTANNPGASLRKLSGAHDAKFGLTLKESSSSQVVKIEYEDMAGNTGEYTTPSVFINSNFFLRWLHNIPLFIVSVVVILLLVGAIIVLLAKRKKSQEA